MLATGHEASAWQTDPSFCVYITSFYYAFGFELTEYPRFRLVAFLVLTQGSAPVCCDYSASLISIINHSKEKTCSTLSRSLSAAPCCSMWLT